MKQKMLSTKFIMAVLLLAIVSCTPPKTEERQLASVNQLLQEWEGPYGGVPAFDKANMADVKDALEKGMEINLKEIDEIANNPEAATFENTIEALQRAGAALNRAFSYYGIWRSNMSSPEGVRQNSLFKIFHVI